MSEGRIQNETKKDVSENLYRREPVLIIFDKIAGNTYIQGKIELTAIQ